MKNPFWNQWKGAITEYRYVLLVVFVGIVFLLLPVEGSQEVTKSDGDSFDLVAFEIHLAENLSQIHGVGKLNVILTLRNDGQKIFAQDTNQDMSGKSSRTTVTIGSGTSQQVIEVQEIYPQFQGAVVVCDGGDNPSVQLQLIQALSSLTGLGSDSITICKRDSES
ncbi:MAG: stage III sporulation protein AG [Eubacteriales bacterium]